MTTPNDAPDLIEAAEDVLTAHPDLGTCESMTRIRAAIASEKALRAEVVRVLRRLEFTGHDGEGFDPFCEVCLDDKKHMAAPPKPEHHDSCALSALLKRLGER